MISNKELGSYLKSIREKLDYSTHDINKLCDISQSYISLMENGKRKPSPIILKKLASIYCLDYIDLYEKAGYIDLIEKENIVTSNNLKRASSIISVYGTIPAGIPVEMIEDIIDTEEIPEDMLKGEKQYFGLKIKGNSMSPDYLDGDTIILEKVDNCESGQDCVVMVNGNDGTFKRVIKNETGIILQPINSEFQPLVYTNEQIETLPVKIIGKVVELRRKVKK